MRNTTEEDIEAQAAITLTSATLSLLGGLALLVTYFRISEFQTSVHRLLVFLTIADILTAFGYILGTANFLRLDDEDRNSSDPVCVAQSFITTFSSLASFAWTSIIAVHLYLLIRKQRDFLGSRMIKILYHFIGWVLPVVATSIVLAFNKLGRDTHGTRTATGLWCWIKITNNDDGIHSTDTVIMFMSGKLWELITYVLSFYVYMMLKFNTYLERKKDSSYSWRSINGTDLRNEDERFCFTWLILYVLRLWGTIRFFLAISNTDSEEERNADHVLKYFHCAGDSAQALGNFLLFCVFNKSIRRKYRERVVGCCKNRDHGALIGNSSSVNYRSV